jgi:hypothetical protein
MMHDIKDSIANGTTIAAAGAAIIDWNALLTMGLLITGMALNIARIIEIRREGKKKED